MKDTLLRASIGASALMAGLPAALHAQEAATAAPASAAVAAPKTASKNAAKQGEKQSGKDATAAAPDAASGTRLSEVVVTAERRTQSAQRVGASISVLRGSDLKELNVNTVNDLQHATPSLEVEPAFGGGQPQFRIRGVGFNDYTSNNASTVGINVDDVAYALPIQTQGQLFDLARVEVLRGPQGTLYGRNTTGGTINFITNKPTKDFEAGVTAEYGSHNLLTTEGYVSGPLSDTVRGRIAFTTQDFGAWQTNRDTGQSLGNHNSAAARGQLDWDVSPDFKVHLGVHGGFDKSDDEGLYLFTPYTSTLTGVTIPADTDITKTGWGVSPAFAHVTGLSTDSKPGKNNVNAGFDLSATWNLGPVDLKSITAFDYLHRREYMDWDATSYHDSDEYFDDTINEFTQELRLSSHADTRLRWVAGLFYSHDDLDEKFYSDFTDRLGFIALTRYKQSVDTLGAYGQATYDITPRLRGIFGIRQEHEHRDLTDFASGELTPSFVPFSGFTSGDGNQSLTSNGTSGKVGLEFDLAPATLLYASISRGYKSGGFTAHNTANSNALVPFEPETLTAYEAGFKSDLTRSLRWNFSAFHYDYRDQQVLSATYDPTSQSLIGTFVNAPKSRIDGFETELDWHPVNGLVISQYVGYKYGKYTAPFVTYNTVASAAAGTNVFSDYNGTSLSFPRLSYGGQVAYSWFAGGYKFRAETNYSYRDAYSQLLLLGPNYTVDGYWLFNASVTVSTPDRHWDVSLWARNLFNRQYDLTKNYFLPGTNVAAAGEPRTVGLRVTYTY
ncbi:TonB-dependent receptor [Paraburkholderia tropica]|uniref:TonB-dependent receptor n=1 Tax=Paraburkholderia tropica TaxID=92647 RepID=UPI002AB7D33D|nr:TonB-dependent receptor [Paraburkholderia tropica]